MQNANRLNVNSYHGQKRQLLGTNGPPPAWRKNVNSSVTQNTASNGRKPSTSVKQSSEGSKILISRLPQDVTDKEIVELFIKTVGPTKDAFLIHNNKGQPKGMAIVIFQRATDAEVARTKFDGKIVDGKNALKIELIVEGSAEITPKNTTTTTSLPQALSLLERMGVTDSTNSTQQKQLKPEPGSATAGKPKPQPTKRKSRTRKGPARLKRRAVSAQDLDREMEEYRAAFPPTNNNFIIFPPKSGLALT